MQPLIVDRIMAHVKNYSRFLDLSILGDLKVTTAQMSG